MHTVSKRLIMTICAHCQAVSCELSVSDSLDSSSRNEIWVFWAWSWLPMILWWYQGCLWWCHVTYCGYKGSKME